MIRLRRLPISEPSPQSVTPSLAARLIRVTDYIHSHLDGPLDLETLAQIACLSPYHFHRCYMAVMNETVAGTVRRRRLFRAALALSQTDRTPASIAREAGYGSLSAFSRAFAALYGKPPGQWRAQRPTFASISNNEGDNDMSHVTILPYPALRLAGLRHVGPYPTMGQTFEKLGPLAGLQGLWGPNSLVVAVTHDDPKLVPQAQLRTDCCLILEEGAVVSPPLNEITIRAGMRACWRHIGPYSDLHIAWPTFIRELTAMAPADRPPPSDQPCFEIYHNDPRSTPPAELITDLYVPLD